MIAQSHDTRRYAWCHAQALWVMGMPVATYLEDLRGALAADQHGLVRYASRKTAEACAVALTLVLKFDRPVPSPSMRATWALNRLGDHHLAPICREIIFNRTDADSENLVATCEQLVEQVREIVGDPPDILTAEGYFPALAMARDWLGLLDSVGENDFLPREWTKES